MFQPLFNLVNFFTDKKSEEEEVLTEEEYGDVDPDDEVRLSEDAIKYLQQLEDSKNNLISIHFDIDINNELKVKVDWKDGLPISQGAIFGEFLGGVANGLCDSMIQRLMLEKVMLSPHEKEFVEETLKSWKDTEEKHNNIPIISPHETLAYNIKNNGAAFAQQGNIVPRDEYGEDDEDVFGDSGPGY